MKTVKKALDILEVFLNGGKEVSISELAEITGQNVSTIHGILQELLRAGYITQKIKRGKYSLGLKFLSFSGTINKIMSIEDIINPFAVELNKKINETVHIAIMSGHSGVNISFINSSHKLRVVTTEKMGTPLYCTGTGKIFLAGMSDSELNKYLKTEKLIAYTPKTTIDRDKLKKQIQAIRLEGSAVDDEEFEIGVRNVAAPVRDFSGKVVASIGVLAPSLRLTKARIKEVTPVLKECAENVSKALGYPGPGSCET
jgi:IclR family transcriptional regulator, KDG regulon repressor